MSDFLHGEDCDAHVRQLRVEYRKQIRKLCRQFLNAARTGQIKPDEGYEYTMVMVGDWIDSQALGSHQMFLALSEKYDAWKDDLGIIGIQMGDGNLNWAGMAYAAVKADVVETLWSYASISVENPATWSNEFPET